MNSELRQPSAYLVAFIVICVAVVGYFVGLQSPMNPKYKNPEAANLTDEAETASLERPSPDSVLPATHYRDMKAVMAERAKAWVTRLEDLESTVDPMMEITVTAEQKSFALALRDQNRAFNGAPPTIPHPVETRSSDSCMVCHEHGVKTETFRISKMSHQFLTNCLQCHVETQPEYMTASVFRENTFSGLPAPSGGPRAYEGAPPMIPHSTWMRVDCLSCHGFTAPQGIRTMHPWRRNCQQCHAPSSELEQVPLGQEPEFLTRPNVQQ